MTQSFSPNDPTLNRSNEVLWKLEENYTAFDWFDILPPPNLTVMVGESLRPITT